MRLFSDTDCSKTVLTALRRAYICEFLSLWFILTSCTQASERCTLKHYCIMPLPTICIGTDFSFSSPPLPSRTLEVGLLNTARGPREHCNLPRWGLTNNLVYNGVKKSSYGGSISVDFPRNKCHFLHKTSALQIMT